MENKKELGITAKKEEDFSKWYVEIIKKGNLIDYTKVSGCIVFKPRSYFIWEKIQEYVNEKLKKNDVENCYFPMFIPESLFQKEAEHVEGFTPEVAWVTHAGETELKEKLAIRPTSETIMYDSFSTWIRSYRDLPLKVNQWCNVVRWEFKHPTPFLRTREFLWQEGHTAFATREEAQKDVEWALNLYEKVTKELLAIPTFKGQKSIKEKFAGAEYTYSIETFLLDGKAIQVATSHHLGQKFSKAFEIEFTDENQEKRLVFQNSWGLTTRVIGIMIAIHSDNKGLVLPPRVAKNKIVIVPIINKNNDQEVLDKARELKKSLEEFNPILDDRKGLTPGYKFNDWELKGIPLRIEIGPKDIEKGCVTAVKRNNGEKIEIDVKEINKKVQELLNDIQEELYKKAEEWINNKVVVCDNEDEFDKAFSEKKWPLVKWCGNPECEEKIKEKYKAKSNNIPFKQPKKAEGKCAFCEREAKYYAFIAKSH